MAPSDTLMERGAASGALIMKEEAALSPSTTRRELSPKATVAPLFAASPTTSFACSPNVTFWPSASI
ncbi:MAG: hypothetical protein KH134_26115, partial [Enterobacter cloacae]|nr:hypothetical protein [Enterobacter cloacae]